MAGACFLPRLTRQPAESYESYGSYGHTVIRSYGGLALRHPAAPARHSLPSLRQGRDSSTENSDFAQKKVGIPTSLFHHRARAEGVSARLSSRVPLAECFFHHSHAQPSILAWAQDCPTQSWRGHRIAPLNPGVGTELPRCLPENSGSASVHTDALPDSPPGLPGKLRLQRRKYGISPGLAQLPGFKFGK